MPPVSSRTTSRSVPSISSRFNGEASYSAGSGLTGRRFAYSPRPLRKPSKPCSGRGLAGSVASHLVAPAATRTPNHSHHQHPDATRPDHPYPNLTNTPISAVRRGQTLGATSSLTRRADGGAFGVQRVEQ